MSINISKLRKEGEPLKLLIAGSRDLITTDKLLIEYIFRFYKKELHPAAKWLEIVQGEARGIDSCARDFARRYRLTGHSFPANWDLYGKSAGYKRNAQMGAFAHELLLIWDGKSRGSASMKAIMQKLHKPIHEVIITKDVFDGDWFAEWEKAESGG